MGSRDGQTLEMYATLTGKRRGSSLASTSFNLVLSTVGVGALTLPYTTATIGWAQSGLLLLASFVVSVYSLYLLDGVIRALPEAAAEAAKTYAEVVAMVLGPCGAYALEGFLFTYSFGLSVSYLGVVGTEFATFAQRLLSSDPAEEASVSVDGCMLAGTLFVVLPVALLPEKVLRYSGALGTLCMVFTTLVVVAEAPFRAWPPSFEACADAAEKLHPVPWVASAPALFNAVPIFTFCMSGATAFVNMRSGMEGNEEPRKVQALIWSSQAIAALNYVVAGAAGYLTFCADAPANVLDGFAASDLPTLAARLALAVQLILACAGVYVPLARVALWHFWAGLDAGAPPEGMRVRLTVPLLATMLLVAWFLNGALELPLDLTSAVCTTAIMFIFPGLCACYTERQQVSVWARLRVRVFAALGLLIGFVSTTSILLKQG